MSMGTINTKEMHEKYEQMTRQRRMMVDDAFRAVAKVLTESDHCHKYPAMDDAAEELIAAITYYVLQSEARHQ